MTDSYFYDSLGHLTVHQTRFRAEHTLISEHLHNVRINI